ncbi:MAG TPA: DUF362 domain-containing protein [Candidatus Kapabacteria bacterium]|nr:DUF362 domain-containing protein [Candidatus Kapabacteria bacterium]
MSKVVANVILTCALILAALPLRGAELGSTRVLILQHPHATQAFTPQKEPIHEMIESGIQRFTGKSNSSAGWQSLITTQDIVGIKVHSTPGRTSGTRAIVVGSLIESLLKAGVPPSRIVVWDRRMVDLQLAGYSELAEKYKVGLAGALDEGFDAKTFYSTPLLGKLVYGDLEFGKKGEGMGRNSYVSKLLTQRITKIVNVTPLLNHNQAGVSGALYGLAMGSIDNVLRFEDPDRLGTAVPEIYALPEIADRVVLNIVDALICQYRGEERGYLHYSTALNELWFSKDPVAVDALAIQVLDQNREEQKSRKSALQIYSNAELMELGVADTNRIRIERIRLGETNRAGLN